MNNVTVKNFRNTIVIDYIKDKKYLRYSTGITKIPNDKSYFKNERLTSKVDNNKGLNQKIQLIKKMVIDIVDEYLRQNSDYPSVNYLKNRIRDRNTKLDIVNHNIINYLDEFIESKKLEIKKNSLKDYKSFKNAVIFYEHITQRKLTLIEIATVDFIKSFIYFLAETTNSDKLFSYRGGLNNKTISKRISVLRTFLTHLESQELIIIKPAVKNYKPNLITADKTIISLTTDELKDLVNIELTNRTEQIVRDVFVFGCQTGMRYSDIISLNRLHINKDGKIEKHSEKTSRKFIVPLLPLAKEIFEKYNYNLNLISLQKFNENIKNILKKNNLLNYNILVTNIKRLEKEEKEVLKQKLISSHTARRTFISHCFQVGISINQIMKYTGHKKVDTLLGYLDRFADTDDSKLDAISIL